MRQGAQDAQHWMILIMLDQEGKIDNESNINNKRRLRICFQKCQVAASGERRPVNDLQCKCSDLLSLKADVSSHATNNTAARKAMLTKKLTIRP